MHLHTCWMLTSKKRKYKQPSSTMVLTSKRFIQLDPVFEDEIAVVLSMPESRFPMELSHACLQTADRARVCGHSKIHSEIVQVGPGEGGSTLTWTLLNFPS